MAIMTALPAASLHFYESAPACCCLGAMHFVLLFAMQHFTGVSQFALPGSIQFPGFELGAFLVGLCKGQGWGYVRVSGSALSDTI